MQTDIHASSGIWTQDSSVWVGDDSGGHCDRQKYCVFCLNDKSFVI
jgi:hypothetical protein